MSMYLYMKTCTQIRETGKQYPMQLLDFFKSIFRLKMISFYNCRGKNEINLKACFGVFRS